MHHRLIYDYVSSVGGVKKVQITPRMSVSCKAAQQRYEDSLIKQREKLRKPNAETKRRNEEKKRGGLSLKLPT